ncbi:MAG TPA: CPBP family intramembrane glutamic endopeptidase [Gemmatimonadales bacterium]
MRAVGLSAAFLVFGFLLAIGLVGLGTFVLWGGAPPDLVPATQLQTASLLTAYGFATWLFGFRLAGLDPVALRWRPAAPRRFARGLLIGAIPASIAMLVAVPVAGATWLEDGGSVGEWTGSVAGLVALLAPAAAVEELIFRGVPLVLLAGAFGRATAVVAMAIVFGVAHLVNPDITGLALGNIALAGVLLGTVFYLPGGIWTAIGAHIGWNLTLAALAAPVSGLPLPVAGIDYLPGGPAWLSGGGFGPEGGLLATAALGAATMMAGRRVEKSEGGSGG